MKLACHEDKAHFFKGYAKCSFTAKLWTCKCVLEPSHQACKHSFAGYSRATGISIQGHAAGQLVIDCTRPTTLLHFPSWLPCAYHAPGFLPWPCQLASSSPFSGAWQAHQTRHKQHTESWSQWKTWQMRLQMGCRSVNAGSGTILEGMSG